MDAAIWLVLAILLVIGIIVACVVMALGFSSLDAMIIGLICVAAVGLLPIVALVVGLFLVLFSKILGK